MVVLVVLVVVVAAGNKYSDKNFVGSESYMPHQNWSWLRQTF